MRPLRLALEFSKIDLALTERGIASTVVVFGSSRVISPEQAEEALNRARDDAALNLAKQQKHLSAWYQEARNFGRIVSERGGALATDGMRQNVIVTGTGRASWRPPIAAQPMLARRASGSTSCCRTTRSRIASRRQTLLSAFTILASVRCISLCALMRARDIPRRPWHDGRVVRDPHAQADAQVRVDACYPVFSGLLADDHQFRGACGAWNDRSSGPAMPSALRALAMARGDLPAAKSRKILWTTVASASFTCRSPRWPSTNV